MDIRSTKAPADLRRLLELPGVELLVTSEANGEPVEVCVDGAPVRPQASVWFRLLAGLAGRLGEEQRLGRPRVIVSMYDERLLVVGVSDEALVGLVLRDPSSVGIAMVKVRQWTEQREEAREVA